MRLLQEIRSHPVSFAKHACLMSCYVALGFSLGIVGPTLLDLRQQVRVSLPAASYCITSRAAGYAIGSLSSDSPPLICN